MANVADRMTQASDRGTTQAHTGQGGTQHTAHEHTEGTVARTIEQQTARLPSDVFMWAAFACMGGSLLLQFTGRKEESLFVGQWVPSLLLFGLYNKLVKVAGSDRASAGGNFAAT